MAMITGRLAFTGPLRVKKRASQKTFPGRMSLRRRTLPVWQGALIVLAVFLAYLPALHGGFVWDDDSWTLNLSALFQSAAGLRTIWCHPAALQQYYPLTGTTFWLARERIGRGPAAAAFFFTGTLFPVLGFMNAYYMRYSFVCDHWVYLSSLGLLAPGAALVARAAEHVRKPMAIYGFAAIVLPALFILTWRQCGMYADMETLWRTMIARNPSCWLAQSNLGTSLLHRGKPAEAETLYREALQLRPDDSRSQYNLGIALAAQGRLAEAFNHFERALQLKPDYADARFYHGTVLGQSGRVKEAAAEYREALKLNPELAGALNNLAWILAASSEDELRNGAAAVRLGEQACELTHYQEPLFIGTLAAAYAEAGRFPEAVTTAEKAEQLAISAGLAAVAAKNRQLLELYRAGKPYHEPAPPKP